MVKESCKHNVKFWTVDMVRTQVQLTGEQAAALKRIAAAQGISMSALIRRAVDQVLTTDAEQVKWQRALALIGRYRSGESDVSVNHDAYLDEAYLP